MKRISKYISSALMMAACVCTFTSCDDWTEPEHIDLDYGTIDTSDPNKSLPGSTTLKQLSAHRVTA